jgi:hypothetical protein
VHHSISVQLVRLVAGGYSEPEGSLGVVESSSSAERSLRHFVAWVGSEHGPHSSGPIDDVDLERVGWLSVRVPDEMEERLRLADLKDPGRVAREALRKALELLAGDG